MKDNQIIRRIKKLENIQPNKAWRDDLRQDLMAQVGAYSNTRSPEETGGFLFLKQIASNYVFSLKHAYVPALLVLLVVGASSVFAAQVAKNSLPGELFYRVKIANERAQISLTRNTSNKMKKEFDFAGRRLQELNTIVKKIDEADTKGSQKAVENFHQEITKVQTRLEEIGSKPENSSQMVKIAKMVDEKTLEFEKSLAEAFVDKIPVQAEAAISAALNTLNDINFKALGIIVEEQVAKGGTQENEDLIARIEGRIKKFEQRIDSLAISEIGKGALGTKSIIGDGQGLRLETSSQLQTAKIFLQQARGFLSKKNLKMALDSIEESNGITSQIEELTNPKSEKAEEAVSADEVPEAMPAQAEAPTVEAVKTDSQNTLEVPKEPILAPEEAEDININVPESPKTYPQTQEDGTKEPDFYGGLIQDNSANDSQIQGNIWKTKKIAP
ncbi:hypothetical protein KKD19_04645 [Patescibacteria group bacterium]|nr:hypothetical protein [Patescibacteria group bacterium]MBU4512497.1 hypothetical protein [Patescibacteria group bacterium]MCG2693524.1 DUF5667 domain-containing protein [Candidatus Parcubacteria bacterium]